MDSLDLCSVRFGVRCRDAGRAFSVFKPVKEKAVIRKLWSREGFFFALGNSETVPHRKAEHWCIYI